MIPVEVPGLQPNECFMVETCTSKENPRETMFVGPGEKTINVRSCTRRLLPTMRAKINFGQSPPTERSIVQAASTAVTCFVSHGSLGIVDSGASQTVIGQHQVQDVLQHLPRSTKVHEVPCHTVFRFGNSSTVQCDRALLYASWTIFCEDLRGCVEDAIFTIEQSVPQT